MTSKELSHAVIGAAMRVHSHFGSGYLEEVYKNALMIELRESGINAEKEVSIPVDYHGVRVGNYQADIIVEKCLILELKAVSTLVPRHEAQLVNYLTATGIDDGILLNFGSSSLQFKHKYRSFTPSVKNPVNPVNPVENEKWTGLTGFTGLESCESDQNNPVNLVNPVENEKRTGLTRSTGF